MICEEVPVRESHQNVFRSQFFFSLHISNWVCWWTKVSRNGNKGAFPNVASPNDNSSSLSKCLSSPALTAESRLTCHRCNALFGVQKTVAETGGFGWFVGFLSVAEPVIAVRSDDQWLLHIPHGSAVALPSIFRCFALMRADSFSFSQEDFLFDFWGSHVRKVVHPNLKRCEGLGNCNEKNILEEEINWCLVSPEPDFSCDEKAVKESCRSSPKSNISCTLGNLGLEEKKLHYFFICPLPHTCSSPRSCPCDR